MYVKLSVGLFLIACSAGCTPAGITAAAGAQVASSAGEKAEDDYERLLAKLSCDELDEEEKIVLSQRQSVVDLVLFDQAEKLDEISEARVASRC